MNFPLTFCYYRMLLRINFVIILDQMNLQMKNHLEAAEFLMINSKYFQPQFLKIKNQIENLTTSLILTDIAMSTQLISIQSLKNMTWIHSIRNLKKMLSRLLSIKKTSKERTTSQLTSEIMLKLNTSRWFVCLTKSIILWLIKYAWLTLRCSIKEPKKKRYLSSNILIGLKMRLTKKYSIKSSIGKSLIQNSTSDSNIKSNKIIRKVTLLKKLRISLTDHD